MSVPNLQAWGLLAAGLALSGCASLPRTAFFTDPLSPGEHVQLAGAYEANGQTALAKKQYESALRSNKKHVPALIGLGNIAFNREDWKKAKRYYRRAVKIDPGNAGAANNLAMTHLKQNKRLDEAQKLIEDRLEASGELKPYLLDTLEQVILARKNIAASQAK
ncbi:MAG: hypothetical protein A2901_06080 [Elusimicrobia bacterium RIFCSPLOWO2_01_FULL_54_10]|nr:MAG: hypothetical protein A2901_06080 [Elusimicrobia bacterium RIFCSPLOWO2_01_FULL_54_10]